MRQLGPEHLDYAIAISDVALINLRLVEEEQQSSKNSGASMEKMRLEHPDFAHTASDLIRFTNRWDEAEQLFKRAITIVEKERGPEDVKLGLSLIGLASVYENTNRWDEAEQLQARHHDR